MCDVSAASEDHKPFKVEVTKNTKGYNWVVRVYGDDLEVVKNQVKELEDWARLTYGDKE